MASGALRTYADIVVDAAHRGAGAAGPVRGRRGADAHAHRLGCTEELAIVRRIIVDGASYERQRRVATENDGDLRAVVDALLDEMRRTAVTSHPAWTDPAWPAAWVGAHAAEVVELRRRITAGLELGFREHETTAAVVDELVAAGSAPTVLPGGTGVICDVGSGPARSPSAPTSTPCRCTTRTSPTGRRRRACAMPAATARTPPSSSAWPGAGRGGRPARPRPPVFQPAEESLPGGRSSPSAAAP